jgi:hypothetical protein
MRRFTMNLFAAAVIAIGGSYLATPAGATTRAAGGLEVTTQAICGNCSGLCCGWKADGSCWAKDICSPGYIEEDDDGGAM